MLNRHGLVAGATGTGKTKTLQLLAEQLSAAGRPGLRRRHQGRPVRAGHARGGEREDQRAGRVGRPAVEGTGFPVEYYALGGEGIGIPLRVTMSAFGPVLLSKVLGLNDTQESSLGLVFHYADQAGLPLLDLADLRAVVQHLTSDEGKADLKELGGLSSATAGVILRELIAFSDQGAEAFFGEPEFESRRPAADDGGRQGLISLVELPNLQDRPAIFSTFLMWLLADLFHDLPEVGDVDKPKLVFFFDEAHLLFDDASEGVPRPDRPDGAADPVQGRRRLLRDPEPDRRTDDVLAQLGSRVQHQLRAHTPNDAKALKATVNTYPDRAYDDLGEVITSLGIGEAVVTVMNERGAPTPVAWTRLRAPESLMAPTDPAAMQATVEASPRHAKYATAVDRESAREMLAAKLEEGAEKAAEEEAAEEKAKADAKTAKKTGASAPEHEGRGRRGQRCGGVGRLQGLHAHRRRGDRPRHVRDRPRR